MEPPSYDAADRRLDDLILPPVTLRAAGRFVYSDDPQAPPLYELSHSIGFLSATDRVVGVHRLQHQVKQLNGAPHVSTRAWHLFDLKHPSLLTAPPFPFHAEATSRRSLCSLGITRFRPRRLSAARGYRVHRAVRGPDHRLVSQDAIFTALPVRDGAVTYEWSDSQGRLLARELVQGGLMSFLIGTELSLGARDALVAAWILKMWWELAGGPDRWSWWHHGKSSPGYSYYWSRGPGPRDRPWAKRTFNPPGVRARHQCRSRLTSVLQLLLITSQLCPPRANPTRRHSQ